MLQTIYTKPEEERLQKSLTYPTENIKLKMMREAIKGYFQAHRLPCMNSQRNYDVGIFPEMGTPESAIAMWNSIHDFIDELPGTDTRECCSYFAIFDELEIESEEHFELLLWTQLQYAPTGEIEKFSQDEHSMQAPNDPDFRVAISGTMLNITGLHPQSTKKYKRFPWPVLVFSVAE